MRITYADGAIAATDELNLVEALDDAVFAALEGDAEALSAIEPAYLLAKARAPKKLLEESRRHFVQRAEDRLHGGDSPHAAWKILAIFAD